MFSTILSSIKLAMGGCLSKEVAETSVDATMDAREIIVLDNIPSITTSKQAIIYCRVSTPQQSIEAQEYACRIYCERKGYTVIDVVKEIGSAYKGNKQPKLRNVISSSRDVNLIIYKLDRFSRSCSRCDEMIETMSNNKINLECITDPVNLSSSLGKLQFREAILKAQFESDQIAERVNMYHRYRAANNIKIPRATYGYRLSLDKKSIVRVNEEQAVIQFIISNYRMTRNSKEITDSIYRVLEKIGSPKDHFVPVDIGNDDDAIILNARGIALLLNDYNIKKNGLPWTAAKVSGVVKRALDLSNLNI